MRADVKIFCSISGYISKKKGANCILFLEYAVFRPENRCEKL